MTQNALADEVLTQKHVRTFIQFGGARPGNLVLYAGQDAQYMEVTGVSAPETGNVTPLWVHDPTRIGGFRLTGRAISAPDLAQGTLTLREKHGSIPRQLGRRGCTFNLYQPGGVCTRPDDFLAGWSDYVMVYEGALVNTKNYGDRSAFGESDNPLQDALPFSLANIYPIGRVSFGEGGSAQITLEAIDIVYGDKVQCADCGPDNDGSQWVYAITKSSGSTPGTAPKLIYSTDGGASYVAGTITGIGDIEDPNCIDIVGKYLVIGTRTAGGVTISGYYYAEINTLTGAPGTFTKVTAGFLAGFQIYDIFVLSPREIFFSADGGYVYKSTDITSGVQPASAGNVTSNALRRIHGSDGAVVAVGNNGIVIASLNRGLTWSAAVANPVAGVILQAVASLDGNVWWAGGANGKLYYTLNGGNTWAEKGFSGSGSGQVRDIVFPTSTVGWLSHDTTTPTARVFGSWDGGQSWTNSSPRVLNTPTFNRANRLAVPNTFDGLVACNNVAVAGLAGDAVDGILLLGKAAVL